MTENEEYELQAVQVAQDNSQQIRRWMDDEAENMTPPEPGQNPLGGSEEDDIIAVESPEAVRTKLGKYKGFQGRSRRLFLGNKFGDHRWSESQYSINKQKLLTEFISQQCQSWKNCRQPYVFIDMFGGLGMWADKFTGEVCAGSPLCIYNTLESEEVNYYGLVFEKDKNRAADLREILYNRRDNITVYNQDNKDCIDVFKSRFEEDDAELTPALLYFDYTKLADSRHIREITTQFPRSDVLIHYNATAFKRAINSPKCDETKAHRGNAQYLTYLFGRRYWYINNWNEIPYNKHNFVTIYGTNVRSTSPLPEYGGFDNILYPYDSPSGHLLRSAAELTKSQLNKIL
jgi:three-Cys-motif partner protein